jgi:hypothetical protein
VLAVRNDNVSGLNGSSGDLGKKWLVGHVWQWIDQGDFGLVPTKKLLQMPSHVEASIATADYQDALGFGWVYNLLEYCFRRL